MRPVKDLGACIVAYEKCWESKYIARYKLKLRRREKDSIDLISVVLEAVVTECLKANKKSFQVQSTVSEFGDCATEERCTFTLCQCALFRVGPLARCATFAATFTISENHSYHLGGNKFIPEKSHSKLRHASRIVASKRPRLKIAKSGSCEFVRTCSIRHATRTTMVRVQLR